ncbi:YbfB/YjiJ family MFS transporter [Ornithinimicrobium sp. LYQ121]|uniref:YbfB/YjiJ family MFS transporter n=1 Tax=Ornithinimicrobium sp. LYQ121 TaxID=3378801 RepID=UPI003851E44D
MPTPPTTARTAGAAHPVLVALAAACGLAAAMGLGRFVYTPLLPVMIEQSTLTPEVGAWLATVNYTGYLLGAALLMWRHDLAVPLLNRGALVALVLSELAMVAGESVALWGAARLVAGVASAFVFVFCARTIAGAVPAGLGYAGVGLGIFLSGALTLLLEPVLGWRELWLVAAALTAVLALASWWLRPDHAVPSVPHSRSGWTRDGVLLAVAYSLEGMGYIIVGTFLVALVRDTLGVVWAGPAAWSVVGLSAASGAVAVSWARRHWSLRALMVGALLLQALSALLPVILPGLVTTIVSGVLFGATFLGLVLTAMTWGARLGLPSAAATLTVVYGLGQIVGPIVVAPTLDRGYEAAFVVATVVLVVAAVTVGWRAPAARGRAGRAAR